MVQDNGTNAPINYSRPPTKPKCNNPLLVLATATTTSNATIKSGRILTTKPTATTSEPSDGNDDTTPTNMTTDTTNHTTNWFWPRVACMPPSQQSTHRFGRTKQSGATTMTMAPKATINCSPSLVLSVLQFYNKHNDQTPCFGRTRQSSAATTTTNATTNSK